MAEYIEREAAIKLLHYNADESCSSVVADFEALPAANVAPAVHGRFRIKRGNFITGGGNPLWCCSNCGQIFGASLIPPKDNYCPNCGAKMQEAR